jgi:hypothetical protein
VLLLPLLQEQQYGNPVNQASSSAYSSQNVTVLTLLSLRLCYCFCYMQCCSHSSVHLLLYAMCFPLLYS